LTDIEGREKLGVLVCLPQTIQSTWHTLPYESKNKSRRKQQIKDYLIFLRAKNIGNINSKFINLFSLK
jgi:hypothetical protein